ncbi:MAG: hypothetical protein C0446_13155, partial [Chitinophaga sp.]|nr:hypothetical protein [Chitinophaga sp.]
MDLFDNTVNINLLIEDFPDLVFWKNKDLIYQGCNKNVARLLGYNNSSEIIGKTDDYLAKKLHWSTERLSHLKAMDKIIIQEGTELSEEDIIPINDTIRIYLTTKKPILKNGDIIGVLGISIDITHIKNMENELKEAKEKNELYLHGLVENLPQLVYWKDKNLIYQGCNRLCAALLNLETPEHIIGKSDNDFGWSSERIEALHQIDRLILRDGKPQHVEDTIPVNGINRVFLTSKNPIIAKNGEIFGILGISTDITEQKRMEEELRKAKEKAEAANLAKTEFI